MLSPNKLKERIESNEIVIGIWNTIGSPLLTEVLASTGLDFQIIDLEHGSFSLNTVRHHVLSCLHYPTCTPIVRIPCLSEWMIQNVMDQGVCGLVVPNIATSEDIREFNDLTHYSPVGRRGFSPYTAAGGFKVDGSNQYIELANNEIIRIAIIESVEGLKRLPDMLNLKMIDVFYFGAYDLSVELGCPGDTKNREIINIIGDAAKLVNNAGKCAGGFVAKNKSEIEWLIDLGMRFITYNVDTSMIYDHIADITKWHADRK